MRDHAPGRRVPLRRRVPCPRRHGDRQQRRLHPLRRDPLRLGRPRGRRRGRHRHRYPPPTAPPHGHGRRRPARPGGHGPGRTPPHRRRDLPTGPRRGPVRLERAGQPPASPHPNHGEPHDHQQPTAL
ncbi:hypothetical protein NI25_20385 [Streptomyces sp. CCM_MD2014]|nr:hypothetical protein NI25_20385 [Streptomyces sp. CCM_MD2014]